MADALAPGYDGASKTADGSHDVRAAQRWIMSGRIKTARSLVMRKAIGDSAIRFDEAGNPAHCSSTTKRDVLMPYPRWSLRPAWPRYTETSRARRGAMQGQRDEPTP